MALLQRLTVRPIEDPAEQVASETGEKASRNLFGLGECEKPPDPFSNLHLVFTLTGRIGA
jgi:hypothetical protein